jgi:hypothetical protein
MESKSFNLFEQQSKLREILADTKTDTFYILNISDRPDRNNKATRELHPVHLTVSVDGESRIIRIPPSWVPIDAGMQAPKKVIAASGEFQRALTAGAILVLDDETGRKIISADQDSINEYSRIMAVAQNVNGAGAGWQSYNNSETEAAEDPWANVTPSVKVNVQEFEENNISESEFRSFMRREERSISALDRRYITEKLPNINISL